MHRTVLVICRRFPRLSGEFASGKSLIVWGCNNLLLYEVGAIVKSEGAPDSDANFYVTCYSVATCLSTFLNGLLSDKVIFRQYGIVDGEGRF